MQMTSTNNNRSPHSYLYQDHGCDGVGCCGGHGDSNDGSSCVEIILFMVR